MFIQQENRLLQNIMLFFPKTPREIQDLLAFRLRELRKAHGHNRDKAAAVTGVPMSTIRRFETTGEISLRQFLKIALVYGDLKASEAILPIPGPTTMDELLALQEK